VVVPSHRRADLLALCLTSVTRFAPPGTEVIVVDDGSRGAIVSRAAAAFDDVKVVRREKAGGFCVAANAGVAAATAPVVELLNDDAEVTAGWADAALRWFADRRVVAVAPLVLQNDPQRRARGLPPLIDTAGDEYDMGGFARKRRGRWGDTETRRQTASVVLSPSPRLPRLPICSPPAVGLTSRRRDRVGRECGGRVLLRRDALVRAGGFPEHFKAYFEDVDLSFRLRRLGAILYDPASVVWHRVSSSYGARPSRRTLELQSCNEERVFWRNVRGAERLRWFPRHAAVLGAKGREALRGRGAAPVAPRPRPRRAGVGASRVTRRGSRRRPARPAP
jgi:GT2 family glycosyltransferase